jgi:hypothetical protein
MSDGSTVHAQDMSSGEYGARLSGDVTSCQMVLLCVQDMSSGEYGARLSGDVRSCQMVLLYIQDLPSGEYVHTRQDMSGGEDGV